MTLSPSESKRASGFTLVELIAVIGIILLLMAFMLPAVNDVLKSRGRKGAVNSLLNTFEQARVLALQTSTPVYVGFADRDFPQGGSGQRNEDFPYTRFMVFRESTPELDGPNAPKYIALTKWISLPKGIAFKSGPSTVTDAASKGTISISPDDKFSRITTAYAMPVVKFNSTGMIEIPAVNVPLYIYEGFWDGSREVSTSPNTKLLDRISFSRFTGRAQLDVTST